MTAVVVLIAALIFLLIAYFNRAKIGERWFTIICFIIAGVAVLAVMRVIDIASISFHDLFPKR